MKDYKRLTEVKMVIKSSQSGNSVGCIFGKEAEILSGIKVGDKVEITADKGIIIKSGG